MNTPTLVPTMAPSRATPSGTSEPSFIAAGLTAVDVEGTLFGFSASIDQDLAVVGGPLMDGVGSVSTYSFQNNRWNDQLQNTLSGAENDVELFGYALQLRDNKLVVGAPGMTLADATSSSPSGIAGAALVYDYSTDDESWSQLGSALRGSGADRFGASVALSGSDGDRLVAVVGAPLRNSANGGVYTFYWQDNDWVNMTDSQQPLTDDTLFGGGMLGEVVAVTADGKRMMAGAPEWGSGYGKVQVFDWNETASTWSNVWQLAGGSAGGKLGSSVAFLDAQTVAVGVPGDSSGNGKVVVYQQASSADSFEQLGESITGSDGQALGSTGTISGSINGNGIFSLVVGTADGSVHLYAYDGQKWAKPFNSFSDLGGAVSSVSMGSSSDAVVFGISSETYATIEPRFYA